jgi:cyclopropane fatty-acyl-phospholipid synthase-like methyltransferase
MSTDQTMEALANLVPMGAHVLDLGCGDGALLAYLQKHRAMESKLTTPKSSRA